MTDTLTIQETVEQAMEEQQSGAEEAAPQETPAADDPEGDASEGDEADGDQHEAAEPDGDAPDEDAGDEPEEIVAPRHWTQEDRDAFNGLTDVAGKELILRQSKSFERGHQARIREFDDKTREHDSIVEATRDLMPQLELAGLDRAAGIRQLVAAQTLLRTNPTQGINYLLQQFGGSKAKEIVDAISKQQGWSNTATSEVDDYVDPQVLAMNGRLDRVEQHNHQIELTAQQAQHASDNERINHFANEVDEGGKPIRPHFETVAPLMGALMKADNTHTLDSAYDQAVHANPVTRKQLLDGQIKAQAKQVGATRKRQVGSAKKASRNANSRNTASKEAPRVMTLRETVQQAADDLFSGD